MTTMDDLRRVERINPGHPAWEGVEPYHHAVTRLDLLQALGLVETCDSCVGGRLQSYLGSGPVEDVGQCPDCVGGVTLNEERLEAARETAHDDGNAEAIVLAFLEGKQ